MSILVVGSVAYDSVETPFGKVTNALGGSALYFSSAAHFFSPVKIVAVVGKDFEFDKINFLKEKNVDFDGLLIEEGKTFRWGGRYHPEMNLRDTLYTELNVFENFNPIIPEHYKSSKYIFLANIDPDLQLNVLDQVNNPELIVLDTMNFWITGKSKSLEDVIKRVDMIILNDEEICQLTELSHLHEAALFLFEMGPKALIVKRGEYGSILITRENYFFAPGYPIKKVTDPTGAGDSFAGGFLGYLASVGNFSDENLRKALVYGTVLASYNIENFSFDALRNLNRDDIERRFNRIREMTRF